MNSDCFTIHMVHAALNQYTRDSFLLLHSDRKLCHMADKALVSVVLRRQNMPEADP